LHGPATVGPPITGAEANIWKYYLFQALVGLQLWYPIWVIYLVEERGLSLTQVTIVEVPFWVASVLVQVPAAAMADRWGRKPMLVASAASLACATILFGVATTYPLLLLSYVIWGAGFAFLYGTESAFIFDSLKASGREHEYTKIYGRGWGVSTAAILAGTLLGAPIAEATSLPFPIIVSGGIVALAALVALTFSEPAPEGGAELPAPYGKIIRDSARMLRENRAITYPVLFYGVITVGYIAPFFFFQPFLIEHGVDVGDVGFWQTPTRLAGVAGALTAAWILTNLGERITFWSMPLALIGALGLLAAWDSKWAVAAFPMIFYVVILSQPAVTDYLNRRVPTEKRATVLSMTSLMRSLVIIPAAPLFGVIADEWSVETAFLAHAVLLAALALPLLVLWNRQLGIRGETGAIMVEPAVSSE
jgi:MFS family permease